MDPESVLARTARQMLEAHAGEGLMFCPACGDRLPCPAARAAAEVVAAAGLAESSGLVRAAREGRGPQTSDAAGDVRAPGADPYAAPPAWTGLTPAEDAVGGSESPHPSVASASAPGGSPPEPSADGRLSTPFADSRSSDARSSDLFADGPRAGLAALTALDPGLPRYAAVSAHLHEADGDLPRAAELYAEAAAKATNTAERDHLQRQATRLR